MNWAWWLSGFLVGFGVSMQLNDKINDLAKWVAKKRIRS